jgi:tetratricopeptide (TPR) repeat protein
LSAGAPAEASRAARLALAAATLAWAAHRALFPLAETDLFFHLKLGELIVARHAIPFRNLFSFTYPAHPDPDLAWAFQVTVALLYRAGGFAAIVVGKTVAVTVAVGLLWAACRRRGASALATALALTAAVEAARPRLVERPHLVTFVGIGALVLLLGEIERRRARLWWWLPLLTFVWAQFHAGVFFCPLVLAGYLLGAWLEGAPSDQIGWQIDWQIDWRRSLPSLALCVLALFATPAGGRLPHYLVWHTGLGATRVIDEFRHADAWNDPWFFALAALAAASVVARGWRRELRQWLPIALVALLAWRSVRFVAEWALLAAPLYAEGLDRALARLLPRIAAAQLTAWTAALALVATITLSRLADAQPPRLAADVVPFDAIDFVTQTGLRQRMFHDLDVGCYLLWEGWPRWQVFEDARLPAYPDELHRALDQTALDAPAFDALLARYGVDAALVSEPGTNRRAGSFDPAEWALVWRRPSALVLARRTLAHRALIAKHEIPLRARFDYAEGTRFEPLPTPPEHSPVGRCEWDRRLAQALDDDGDPERALDARADALERACLGDQEAAQTRFLLGARLQRNGQLERASAEYDRALALAPTHAGALINRGWARLRTDPRAAQADFQRALPLAPARAAEIKGALRLLDAAPLGQPR